jgi:hypothetical protein
VNALDDGWDEKLMDSKQSIKEKRSKANDHELEELREHIDLISFNIGKVYRHAKDRSRKEYNKAKNTFKRRPLNEYRNEKIRV